MSTVKFQCPSYKLFEPDCHPHKPIIVGVDDRLESPETLTLRYEEAARVANGEALRRDSSPRLLEMAAYSKAQLPSMHAGYDAARYQEAPYEQYPTPTFPAQQQTDKFAQLNQQSFTSNNGVSQYVAAGPTAVSLQPTSGGAGTKIFVKVSSQYDLFSLSTPMPYLFLLFGEEKCTTQDVSRDSQDSSGYGYTCTAEVPRLMVPENTSNNFTLSLLLETPGGGEISRTIIGTFQYIEGSGDDVTRTVKAPKHDNTAPAPAVDQPDVSPKSSEPQISAEGPPPPPPTNTYEYPAQPGQYANPYPQASAEMISTYRNQGFSDPLYHRRAAGWNGYPNPLGSTGRSPGGLDAALAGRQNLTPLPMPQPNDPPPPQLIRTSTIANNAGNSGSYPPVSIYSSKAVLKLVGKLESMAENWTHEEWENRRRIVMFRKSQNGSTLTASCRPVSVNERPPNSICISCIWWQERGECFVTSVDTIHLLEQLVAAPNRFSVEEKNRIRRNLEGFHPLTVSKSKADSEEFFKIIMAFPNPKPRNIEKDVKVFPWKILEPALKKIIGKYSASPSSTLPPANVMTPPSYPPPPGPGVATSQADVHNAYPVPAQHHDSIPSPRSLAAPPPGWAPYPTPSRALSPNARHPSPQLPQLPQPALRINTAPLPAVSTYDSRTGSAGGYASSGVHTPIGHHSATPPRWESTPSAATYPESYSGLAAPQPPPPPAQYAGAPYPENAPRA